MLACVLAFTACGKEIAKTPSVPPSPATNATQVAPVVHYTYEVVAVWPHDTTAFSQGLVLRNGALLESTGLNGRSSLREVEIATGKILKQVKLASQYFGEGLAVIGDRAYQLTWQNGKGFVYDADTFQLEQEFSYAGEGWGLTTDGKLLILSDGTDQLQFMDPFTFKVVRSVGVTSAGRPVYQLNELEWINGEVFANVWQTNQIVRIEPTTGEVKGVIDFSGLLAPADRGPHTDVFNGIAYDPATDRLFVTGKNWPKVFEVRLKVRP